MPDKKRNTKKHIESRVRLSRTKIVKLANFIYNPDNTKKLKLLAEVHSFLPEKFRDMLNYRIKSNP